MALDLSRHLIPARPPLAGAPKGAASQDALAGLRLSHIVIPLKVALSDAKVLTGRQSPLTHVDILAGEAVSEAGHRGMGFSYALRAGGAGIFALASEIAPRIIGQDPNDIGRLWELLRWQTNSLGRGGMCFQTIGAFDVALWDMKAKRAGMPLAKLLGAHRDTLRIYNSEGQYLQASLDEIRAAADRSLALGIGGIKMKVGQPDGQENLRRIDAMRAHLPDDIALMIDANQQSDRACALQFGRIVDELGLAFIEEPLDALDFEGHAALARDLATPVAAGEMLTSLKRGDPAGAGRRLRHQPGRRAADRRRDAVPEGHGDGRGRACRHRAALGDGAARAPGRGLPRGALDRAFPLARAPVRGTARDRGRPGGGAAAPRAGAHVFRAGAGLD